METIIKDIFKESKFKGLCACAGVLVGGMVYGGLNELGSEGKILNGFKKLCDGINDVVDR